MTGQMTEADIGIEQIAQVIADVLQTAEDCRWAIGDLLLELEQQNKMPPLRTLGGMVGVSAAYLSVMRTVANCFPPAERAADQKWQLHRLCAYTDNPVQLLNSAILAGWNSQRVEEFLAEEGVIRQRKGAKVCKCLEPCCSNHQEQV